MNANLDTWTKCVKHVKQDLGHNKDGFMMISGPVLKKSLQAYCLLKQ